MSDYECQVFENPDLNASVAYRSATPPATHISIPPEVFFDLQADQEGEHKLYVPGSVLVKQPLTQHLSATSVALERCSGALSSVLMPNVSISPVSRSFLLFLPERSHRNQNAFNEIELAMQTNVIGLHDAVNREDVKRDLDVPDDTWHTASLHNRKKIAISCSFKDREAVLRIVRALNAMGEPYRVLLDSLLWLGNTSMINSQRLIRDADAVFIVMSKSYIDSWQNDPAGNIAAEVREILTTKAKERKVVLPLLPYSELDKLVRARWADFDTQWTNAPIIVPEPLRGNSGEHRRLLTAACSYVNT